MHRLRQRPALKAVVLMSLTTALAAFGSEQTMTNIDADFARTGTTS
jgi:hypothetical protein